MHRSQEFILRTVAGKTVVVPIGQAAETFRGMITLNKSGKFLWDCLAQEQSEESLAKALVEKYGITEERAMEAVKKFLEPIYPTGAIIK